MKIITCNLGMITNEEDLLETANKLHLENADIIVFQEVIETETGKSTIDIINTVLNLPFSHFVESHDHSKDYGKGILQEESVIEGLGILAKNSFKTQKKELTITKGLDRWPRIEVTYIFETFSVSNIHLSKHTVSREKEVAELSDVDIICGDFNMFPQEFLSIFEDHFSSYTFEKYVSFPSKNETLDYIVSKKYKVLSVKTIGISDHEAVVAELDFS